MLNERTGQQVIAEGQEIGSNLACVLLVSPPTSGWGFSCDVWAWPSIPSRLPRGQISNIEMIPGESFQSVDMSISSKPHAIDHVLLLSLVEPLASEDEVTKAAEALKMSETSEGSGRAMRVWTAILTTCFPLSCWCSQRFRVARLLVFFPT